jgi:hypothetical protein
MADGASGVMGQKGFFDVERRLDAISALGDPLETIKKIVPWEDFRTDIEAVTETKLSGCQRGDPSATLRTRSATSPSLVNLQALLGRPR